METKKNKLFRTNYSSFGHYRYTFNYKTHAVVQNLLFIVYYCYVTKNNSRVIGVSLILLILEKEFNIEIMKVFRSKLYARFPALCHYIVIIYDYIVMS